MEFEFPGLTVQALNLEDRLPPVRIASQGTATMQAARVTRVSSLS